MASALKAGVAYFAIVFAVGFLLGTLRVVALAPYFGETASVLIEGPVILTASWMVCGRLITRLSVAPRLATRLTMGTSAFGYLMVAEVFISVLLFERTLGEHLAHYQTTPGLIGLLGQMIFATFPAIQLRLQPNPAGRE